MLGCTLALLTSFMAAGALAAAPVVRRRTGVDNVGVSHACCAVWVQLQKHQA